MARTNAPRRKTLRGNDNWTHEKANELTERICATYQDGKGVNHLDESVIPQSEQVLNTLERIREILFPGYTGKHAVKSTGMKFVIGDLVNRVYEELSEQLEAAFCYHCDVADCDNCTCGERAQNTAVNVLERLPDLREILKTDTQAAFDGDPAAKSTDEIILAYPGLQAISIHRIAHELYKHDVSMLPRIMSEYAHRCTGIDIHPGARIGESFFIDHGTGVVIGETAVLGKNVKLYQGVTLGALSFPKDERGQLIKGQKRHPNIQDNVTIYAGANLLGDITIGENSVIGGNVWLTESVAADSKVHMAEPELSIRKRKKK